MPPPIDRSLQLTTRVDGQEATIVAELNAAQGKPVEIGGYYRSSPELTSKVMRPSATFNAALAAIV
jgi:isocitrate dehydrogenase